VQGELLYSQKEASQDGVRYVGGLGLRYTGDISQVYKDNAVFQFQAHYLFGGK
jgi:hypothetical protein